MFVLFGLQFFFKYFFFALLQCNISFVHVIDALFADNVAVSSFLLSKARGERESYKRLIQALFSSKLS